MTPEEIEQIKHRRYGWGFPYSPSQCAEEVRMPPVAMDAERQCPEPPGYGPGGLFCERHSRLHESEEGVARSEAD